MFDDKYLQPFLDMSGYKPQTTFWSDFSIADKFGEKAVRDTFKRAFDEWKTNHIYLTELVLILNWKIWEWHELGNDSLAKVYDELWGFADNYALENLQGDEKSYFLHTTD